MENSKIAFMTVSLFLVLFGGCAQNSDGVRPLAMNADTSKIGLATFTLETVNEKGEGVSSFKENQNIILSFTISNGDDKPLLINYWDFPVNNPDFFLISQYTSEGKRPIGKSFRLGGNTRDLSPQIIPANSVATYEAPWLIQNSFYMPLINNQPTEPESRRYMPNDPSVKTLIVGKYNSSFSLNINGQKLKMSVDFDVE